MNGKPAVTAAAVLGHSLIVEDLRTDHLIAETIARSAAETDHIRKGQHLLEAACAALLAGEPKRAAALVDQAEAAWGTGTDPRLVNAMRTWSIQLESNWYPGNIGSEAPSPFISITPAPGDPWTIQVEYVVACGPPALLTSRAIIEAALGQANLSVAAQMANQAVARLEGYIAYAEPAGRADVVGWCRLAQADLAKRTGRDDIAQQTVDLVGAWAAQNGQPHLAALALLMQGDWAGFPASWPETLGHHLAPSAVPRQATAPDLAAASQWYEQADAIAMTMAGRAAPSMLGPSIALRRAAVAWAQGDVAQYRQQTSAAGTAFGVVGAKAMQMLSSAQLFLADIAEGSYGALQAALDDVGSGWSQPVSGRLAEIRNWTEKDGSTSWCAGIGRLLERAGDVWKAAGEQDRAALAYRGALLLQRVEPRIPSRTLATAVAGLDMSRNLHARAMVQLERIMLDAPEITDPRIQMAEVGQELEVLLSSISALRSRTRASGEAGAQGLLRVRKRLERLQQIARDAGVASGPVDNQKEILKKVLGPADADLAAKVAAVGEDEPLRMMLENLVGIVQEQLGFVDFLVLFSRAEDARRRGLVERADEFTAAALAAAQNAPPMAETLVLMSADRMDEARAALAKLVTGGAMADDVLAELALRVNDPKTAAAAFARSGQDPATTGDWRVAVTGLELALAAEQFPEAVALAEHGIQLFERSIASLARDVDRVAACDDPTLAALYTLGALAHATRPGSTSDEHADAVDLMERARSGAIDLLLAADEDAETSGDDGSRWREAAASWAAEVDDFLAKLDVGANDVRRGLARIDAAEEQLLEIERARRAPAEGVRGTEGTSPMELAARLPDGNLVIEYQTVGEDLLVAAIGAGGINVEHRPVRSLALSATIRAHHERCADGSGAGEAADQLAKLLLEPVADQIRAAQRLVLVPFGPLNLVPVHALQFDGAPLGVRRVCSYAPTAELAVTSIDAVLTGVSAAVVGDPAFEADRHPRLRRLPGAATEAHLVAARTSTTDVLVDAAATEPAVRSLIVGRDIVHLATHGYLNELGPYSSSLVLAGPDELTVAELVGMRVGAGLAVLSACDTGRGAATLGGDVVGLTRALISAGVQQSIVSLWPVDDVTACVTMAAFYDHLQSERRPAHALASAQADVYALDHSALMARYSMLCTEVGTAAPHGQVGMRRGELDDDEPIPEPLGGNAERHWAPFVLISACRAP